MYKILVTTWKNVPEGVSVHTLIVEFPSREQADRAAALIQQRGASLYSQTAICLY